MPCEGRKLTMGTVRKIGFTPPCLYGFDVRSIGTRGSLSIG
jgi:hypothetical protein